MMRFTAIALLLAIGAGCGDERGAAPASGGSAPELAARYRASAVSAPIDVEITPDPSPFPVNRHFTMTVAVTDRRDAATRSPLALDVDADMPDHRHGMNVKPEIESLGDGRFIVRGMLLHMPGRWEIYATLTDERGFSERLTFTTDLK